MALKSLCSTCGKIIDYGTTRCEECKEQHKKNMAIDIRLYDKTERKHAAVYHDSRWLKLTERCKNRFHGLDIYQLFVNQKIVYGNMSHHIIDIDENYDRRFDIENLIYLNEIESHRHIHSVYEKSERDKKEIQTLLFSLIKRWKAEYV